jgi:hypothetical protein
LRSRQGGRRFDELAPEARQFFDELVADPLVVSGAREVLDTVG